MASYDGEPLAFGEGRPQRDAIAPGTVDNGARSSESVLGNEYLLDRIFSFYPVRPLRNYGSAATRRFGPYIFDADGEESDLNVRQSRSVLLEASLTSKTFFYRAVRALWKSIDSIIPLVKLVSGVVMQNGRWTTSMAVSEEDLQRFDFYACLVKTLVFSDQELDELEPLISPHIIPLLHNHRPQGLLPSLQVLEIKMDSKPLRLQDMWHLNSLIPSAGSLSQLILRGIPDSTQGQVLAASIIKSVHIKTPRLTSISLSAHELWAIHDVVRNIESLQSVSLDLRRPSSDFVPAPSNVNKCAVSNLVNLHVRGSVYDVNLVFDVIFAGALSQLKNLKISLVPLSLSVDTRELDICEIKLMNEILLRQTSRLESLVLEHDNNLPAINSVQITNWVRFTRSLDRKFRALKALSVPVLETVSSLTIATMFATPHQALVWLDISSPKQTRNGLSNGGFEQSARALKAIHNMVPNLRYLAIPILLNKKDDHLQFIQRDLEMATSGHGLEELHLKPFGIHSKRAKAYPKICHPSENISDLLMIARYIDHLFPRLREMSTGGLREFVQEKWLDGFEIAVKQYGELRKSLTRQYEACGREQ